MDESTILRSNELMSRQDAALVVIDVQQKLLPFVNHHASIVWNIGRLIDGAGMLGVPVFATEQYPQGLGHTTPELATRLGQVPQKLSFSCGGCPDFVVSLREAGRHKLLLTGIEAHVCVQQTAMDLMTEGYQVFLAIDAIGSRNTCDYETAVRRMESCGVTLTTTEAALFEWCEIAGTSEFKQISALVRADPPCAVRPA